jgi:DNA repair exonuclease SbcCD ATPase subunit
MQFTPQAEPSKEMQPLIQALMEWSQTVSAIESLAQQYLEIDLNLETSESKGILKQKQEAYEQAQQASERYLALQKELRMPTGQDLQQVKSLREQIQASLEHIASLEAKAEEITRAQLNELKQEFDKIRQSRKLNKAYVPQGTQSPRFLDQSS